MYLTSSLSHKRRTVLYHLAWMAGLCLAPGVHAEVSYQQQIRPILEHRCVACHSCYDAPCQLVLTHPDGLHRGASKQPVYNSTRLKPATPTRLHIDAQTIEEWRQQGFYSVLGSAADGSNSLLAAMVALRHNADFKPGEPLPEKIELGIKRNNSCPTEDELSAYRNAYPHGGMPFAMPALSIDESRIIDQWLSEGAQVDQQPVVLSTNLQQVVRQWEDRLNARDPRHRLVARWLYEHLFMAHLYFPAQNKQRFFRLLRSRTPSGQAIEVIATRRPNDAPGQPFYYRLQPIDDTIVFKTHVTFALDKKVADRIDELFFASDWMANELPGYGEAERTNPFETFAAIPSEARYRFMLDHIEYFIRTFIRGPVCHGQIATQVIRDRFWVLFQDPDSDAYVFDDEYRRQVTPLMDITGIDRDLLTGARTWYRIRTEYNRYNTLRRKAYENLGQAYAGLDDIWQRKSTTDRLTVFRHFDNASVVDGFAGDPPDTIWWMDFPLLERGYYNLVVNFDVFGSLAHQAQTRFYFDLIRNDAERNFLRLMPKDRRQAILNDWYQGMGKLKLLTSYQDVSVTTASGIDFQSDTPRLELLQRLRADSARRPVCEGANAQSSSRCVLDVLVARPAAQLAAVNFFPEVSLLRIRHAGRSEVLSLFRDRAHSNVAFLFGENLRWQPERDMLSLMNSVVASYPNFLFDIPADELSEFVATLQEIDTEENFTRQVVERWGLRRTDPDFWNVFDDVTAWQIGSEPVEAGLLDLGRYQNL